MAFISNLLVLITFSAFFQVVRSAAIGDIARNLQSDLILLDAGLNPQTRKSGRLSLDDVPAGKATQLPNFGLLVENLILNLCQILFVLVLPEIDTQLHSKCYKVGLYYLSCLVVYFTKIINTFIISNGIST